MDINATAMELVERTTTAQAIPRTVADPIALDRLAAMFAPTASAQPRRSVPRKSNLALVTVDKAASVNKKTATELEAVAVSGGGDHGADSAA